MNSVASGLPRPGPPRPGLRGRVSRPALVVLGVLLLALAMLWGLGGLRAAPATGVRVFAAGVPIDLQRWTILVQRAELANTTAYDSPQQTTIRVWMRVTFHGEKSIYGLNIDQVTLVVPGGPPPGPDASEVQVEGYSGDFDPEVERPLVLDFTWPAEAKPGDEKSQPAVPRVPAEVDVVIRDERSSSNYLDPESWSTTRAVGYVPLVCRDMRK